MVCIFNLKDCVESKYLALQRNVVLSKIWIKIDVPRLSIFLSYAEIVTYAPRALWLWKCPDFSSPYVVKPVMHTKFYVSPK